MVEPSTHIREVVDSNSSPVTMQLWSKWQRRWIANPEVPVRIRTAAPIYERYSYD